MRLTCVLLVCALAGCQPSPKVTPIEAASGLALVEAINEELEMPAKEKAKRISVVWAKQYATIDLHEMDDSVLSDALKATNIALFYGQRAGDATVDRYLNRLLAMHAVLIARGVASDDQTSEVFDQLVALRRFEEARQFQAEHHSLSGRDMPRVRFAGRFDARAPATMALSSDGSYVVRNELPIESRVVALIGCEVSAKAVEALAADTELMKELEAANVLWLTAATPGIETAQVEAWNARFPRQPMRVAWSNAAWEGLDLGAMPTFHYLKDGRVSELHAGWDPARTPAEIRAALARLRATTPQAGGSVNQ